MYIGTFLQDPDFIRSLYILAFALFIIDLRLMNHPRTARRGNVIGAIGMGIAVVATLLIESVGDYGLIVLGTVDGLTTLDKLLLVIAIAFGTINIVGGFLVTDRMLEMFKRRD